MAEIPSGAAPRLRASAPDLPPDLGPDGSARHVLSCALLLFAQRGFHGTSIREIGKASGMQSASLYAHFCSKEQILAELILIGHEEHHRRLRRALVAGGATASSQMRAVMREHVLVHAEFPVLITVANDELHALPAPLAAPAIVLRRQSEGLFVDVIQRGVEQGEFMVPSVWLALAAIGAMGIRVAAWYAPGLGIAPQEVAASYALFALRLLGVADEKG